MRLSNKICNHGHQAGSQQHKDDSYFDGLQIRSDLKCLKKGERRKQMLFRKCNITDSRVVASRSASRSEFTILFTPDYKIFRAEVNAGAADLTIANKRKEGGY